MADRLGELIGQQVLLRNIGDVLSVLVLGIKTVERLVFRGPDLGRNGQPPLLRVGEDGVNVENDAPERIDPALDDLSNAEFSKARSHKYDLERSPSELNRGRDSRIAFDLL